MTHLRDLSNYLFQDKQVVVTGAPGAEAVPSRPLARFGRLLEARLARRTHE